MTAVLTLGGPPQTAGYVTDDPEAIKAFLVHNPFLAPLLTEALPRLEAAFGAERPFVVAVDRDPEIPGWEELVVVVETPLDVEAAATRLDTFETTWWLDQLPRAQGKLFFTLEFV